MKSEIYSWLQKLNQAIVEIAKIIRSDYKKSWENATSDTLLQIMNLLLNEAMFFKTSELERV